MQDPLTAAMNQRPTSGFGSYFPAANQMLFAQGNKGLLDEIEGTFYGGGHAPPTPTPTPQPIKPTRMTLTQLMEHFGVNTGGYYG